MNSSSAAAALPPDRAASGGQVPKITGPQIRAARALLQIDQRELARRSGLSVPFIQCLEAKDGVITGNVEQLRKLVQVIAAAGIEPIEEGAVRRG